MELFVAKELKDKITPIEETLKERKEEIDKIFDAVATLTTENKTIDKHYNSVVAALLSKQGIILTDINEYNILQAYK